ncbi:Serpentine receptor class delta-33 [Caenorhabditis elegans]|uniref:Serpentine receptor class delta-33 n=1 Tax=Caenorhabditis elegans TaxID=6239 RepID=SRD33_CAEEL|nr:Serpentine receptor class delta-33 [Caenorhabditis elegans]O01609.3 RecName: Full=Serpentine receptor class delta-33; Short=Protein srd-33 [Caenorhabditis elegans]CCD67000.1 Serpentine receptor class delta-33 [Caenorhabditis elegans]|eukprot:NP_504304.2 Serpentine receptor class delta-33 [Caenorhabditis elegans]
MPILRSVAAVLAPFTSDTYMNTADSIFVITVTILTSIGFLLNLLLLYLIIWKSPRNLTPYRIFLANTTITQLVYALFAVTSMPRVLAKHQYTIVIYLGPVQFFGEWFSYMSYVGILHLSLNSFISLMLSMIYRYFSIRFKRFTANTSIILCIIGYFFPFLIFASCSNIAISSSLSFNTAVLDGMVENLESYHMVLTTEISNHPSLIILTLAVTCGLVPIYFVMYWCRHQIHKTLKQTRSVHSPSTRDNARRLVRALTIQSIIPLVSVFPASIFWCLSQLGFVEPTMYSYFIIPCLSLGCIADPVVTIRCVLPYRRWILKLCNMSTTDMITSNQDKSTIFQKH